MAWRWTGDKPLSEPMMVRLLTHICGIRLQWVCIPFINIGPCDVRTPCHKKKIPIYSHNSAIYLTLVSSKAFFFGVRAPPKLLSMDANHTKRSVQINYWRNSRTLWLVKQIPNVSEFLEILSKVPMAPKNPSVASDSSTGFHPRDHKLNSHCAKSLAIFISSLPFAP